jgi:hypothetical protein
MLTCHIQSDKTKDTQIDGATVMAEEKRGFWTTLPGILTGVAGLITAMLGVYSALQHANSAPKPEPIARQEESPHSSRHNEPEREPETRREPETKPSGHLWLPIEMSPIRDRQKGWYQDFKYSSLRKCDQICTEMYRRSKGMPLSSP